MANSKSVASVLSGNYATPELKSRLASNLEEVREAEIGAMERRWRLSKTLADKNKEKKKSFKTLLTMALGDNSFEDEEEALESAFLHIGRGAPSYHVNLGQSVYGGDKRSEGIALYGIPNPLRSEKALVVYFKWMYEEMKKVAVGAPSSGDDSATQPARQDSTDASASQNAGAGAGADDDDDGDGDGGITASPLPANVSLPMYNFVDHQDHKVKDTELRPDGAFIPLSFDPKASAAAFHFVFEAKLKYVDHIPGEVMGQIGDYVRLVLKAQFTRTFASVIYLSGNILWLLIFAPDKWYQCKLGPICHNNRDVSEEDAEKVASTLAKLWFVLTRPTEEFGHFCPMVEGYDHIKFVRTPTDDVLSTAELTNGFKNGSFKIAKPIHSKFSVCGGRMSYIFKDEDYHRKDGQIVPAILKLSWTPVNRLPEGLIYEYLGEMGLADKIPKVYESGIVSKNVFGYRVEYIIMEDCGQTLKEHVLELSKGQRDTDVFGTKLLEWLKQTISILGYACASHVFHRDISTGNLAIGEEGIKVLDWGLAKIKKEVLIELKDLTAKWLLTDVKKVALNEELHDKLTGTPLYAGIRILAGAITRGLMDDIESVFYSALHLWALYNRDEAIVSNIMAYMFFQTKVHAGLRAGCVSDRSDYLRSFGADDMPMDGELRKFLDQLHKALFMRDGISISMKMANRPAVYQHELFAADESWLFDEDLRNKLKTENLGDSSPSGANRRREIGFSSNTQHGGSTHVEVTGREGQQGTGVNIPNYCTLPPPYQGIPAPLFQGQSTPTPLPQGQRVVSIVSESSEMQEDGKSIEGSIRGFSQGSNRQDTILSSSQPPQSQQQQQQQQASVQQENDGQSELLQIILQQSARIAQMKTEIQQLKLQQGSGNSQDTGEQPNKRQRNE